MSTEAPSTTWLDFLQTQVTNAYEIAQREAERDRRAWSGVFDMSTHEGRKDLACFAQKVGAISAARGLVLHRFNIIERTGSDHIEAIVETENPNG